MQNGRNMKSRSMMKNIRPVLIMFGLVCVSNAMALLDTKKYGFGCITNNNPIDSGTGQSQLGH